MTELNATGGKWTVVGENIVSGNFVSWIAKINMDCYKFKHNADLIAAAPQLYECLSELVDLFDDMVAGEYPPDSFTTQPAKEILAKARGD
jgi:hypothetical protein